MKILWVKGDFLHPVNRGGRIRTLEMLRRLHRRHEIHYVGYADPAYPQALEESREYASRAYPLRHRVPRHFSPAFFAEVALGTFQTLPVAVRRYRSDALRTKLRELVAAGGFDRLVCDFPNMAANLDDPAPWVLFQHNVETMIWRRHAATAPDPLRRAYFGLQAARMFRFEREVCRRVAHIVAVSDTDARSMRELFGVDHVSAIPTGVDVEAFTPSEPAPAAADLIFVGSMDWLPNIDGVRYFVREILPLIRRRRPDCSLVVAGRSPTAEIRAFAAADPRITVTGTVADVRPYLWGARVSIVPLRIGGGTRLKVYESMAARVPVVSTTVGAEGLQGRHPEHLCLADEPEEFARQCVQLLEDAVEARRMAAAAWDLVAARFSWDRVTREFESILERVPGLSAVQR